MSSVISSPVSSLRRPGASPSGTARRVLLIPPLYRGIIQDGIREGIADVSGQKGVTCPECVEDILQSFHDLARTGLGSDAVTGHSFITQPMQSSHRKTSTSRSRASRWFCETIPGLEIPKISPIPAPSSS